MIRNLAITLTLASSVLYAQESAKSLFMDNTSGVSLQQSNASRHVVTRTPVKPVASGMSSNSAPNITGLGYWIELKTGSGQLIRTTSKQIFHSGERIQLHVTSNVNGQLTILQSQDGGAYTKLFPTNANPSGRVDKMQTNVFPSPDHWFRFDNRPGDIHLMLMVQADNAALSQASGSANTMNTSTANSSPSSDQELEAKLRMNVDKLRGSKALVVEDDAPTSPEPTSYVVVDTRRDSSVPGGLAAIEIKLNHQ